jgi:hypothetical protein
VCTYGAYKIYLYYYRITVAKAQIVAANTVAAAAFAGYDMIQTLMLVMCKLKMVYYHVMLSQKTVDQL